MTTRTVLSLLAVCLSLSARADLKDIMDSSSQMVVVVTESENSSQAKLWLMTREKGGWQSKKVFPAVIGRNGIARGLGVYQEGPFLNEKEKVEGDGNSPSGVFELGDVYGYAPTLPFKSNLNYHQSSASLKGVDDPQSRFYNQIVDVKLQDWKSHEDILRKDGLYKWLIEIKHNPNNIKGKGSLIFLHVWKGPESSTAGCTALAEKDLLQVLSFLDRKKNPRFVLLNQDKVLTFLNALKHTETKYYRLRVNTYIGFGGAGPKMREEEVTTKMDQKDAPVARKVFVDETNELREIAYRGPEGDMIYATPDDPKVRAEVEKYFKLASP